MSSFSASVRSAAGRVTPIPSVSSPAAAAPSSEPDALSAALVRLCYDDANEQLLGLCDVVDHAWTSADRADAIAEVTRFLTRERDPDVTRAARGVLTTLHNATHMAALAGEMPVAAVDRFRPEPSPGSSPASRVGRPPAASVARPPSPLPAVGVVMPFWRPPSAAECLADRAEPARNALAVRPLPWHVEPAATVPFGAPGVGVAAPLLAAAAEGPLVAPRPDLGVNPDRAAVGCCGNLLGLAAAAFRTAPKPSRATAAEWSNLAWSRQLFGVGALLCNGDGALWQDPALDVDGRLREGGGTPCHIMKAAADVWRRALTEPTLTASVVRDRLLEVLQCPITEDVLRRPVTLSDGHTYSEVEIEIWLKDHKTSPLTNLPVGPGQRNRAVERLVRAVRRVI